jgi:hypothetical protein
MQGNDGFRLIVRRGPQPNQAYELNKDIITLGRDITNDIVINDPEVSRHHMRLTRGAGGFTLEDLGSTNGTFVNGQRLAGAKPLNNGDMIGLGETVTLGYEASTPMGAPVGMNEPAGPTAANPIPRQQFQQPGPLPAAPQQPQAPQPQYGGYNAPSSYSPQQPSYSAPPAPQAPAAPGYGGDYDPYAVREEEPRNTLRWVLIGCAGLGLFCCCGTVAGLFIIDQACLWDSLPVISNVLSALGYYAQCA